MSPSPTVKPPRPKRWIRYVADLGYAHTSISYTLTSMSLRSFATNEVELANARAGGWACEGAGVEVSDVKARYVKSPPREWLTVESARADAACQHAAEYRAHVNLALGGSRSTFL